MSKGAEQPDITKLMKKIEDIIDWFESDQIDINQALKKYEQGLGYIEELEKFLAEAKVKVTKINKKFD